MTEAFCSVCGRTRQVSVTTWRVDPANLDRAAIAALRVTCPKVDEGGECDVQIRERPSGVQIREGEHREQAA